MAHLSFLIFFSGFHKFFLVSSYYNAGPHWISEIFFSNNVLSEMNISGIMIIYIMCNWHPSEGLGFHPSTDWFPNGGHLCIGDIFLIVGVKTNDMNK